ncbi:MAG: FecR family protein [Kofleriaceae bacterium]
MNRVGQRIPVEPLDDERMTNIERRIVSRAVDAAAKPVLAPRNNTALGFALIGLFLLGAGFVGWKLRGAGSPDTTVAAAPLRIETAGLRSTLDVGDASITSDPDTAFVVTRPGTGVLVELARGKVALAVGKRGARAPLIVRAGNTDVVVVGTRFSVEYVGGEVSVRVTEGVVKVLRRNHSVEARVAAGQAWQAPQGVVALAALPERKQPLDTIAEAGDREVELDLGAPDVLRDRVAKVPDARTPARGSADGAGARPSKADQTSRPTLDPGDPQGDLKSLIRAQPVFPALDVGEPDALKQIAIYQAHMREQQGEDHLHAFYSMAVVQSMKLNRSADALTTLERFMRRAPVSSEFYLRALWLKVRIHCVRAIDEQCRQAAEQYRRRAGDSKAATVAELVTLSH